VETAATIAKVLSVCVMELSLQFELRYKYCTWNRGLGQ
jgi:hypothetical protein